MRIDFLLTTLPVAVSAILLLEKILWYGLHTSAGPLPQAGTCATVLPFLSQGDTLTCGMPIFAAPITAVPCVSPLVGPALAGAT